MTWSLELAVLAWLCLSIKIQIPHNQLNGRQVETPNPGFFDDSIPIDCLILLMSDSSVLQILKIIYNIIRKSVSKGGSMFSYFSSRNSKISHFGHLPLILKSSTNNTHHHPYSLLIVCHIFLQFVIETCSSFYLEMHTGSWKEHCKHHHQQWAPSSFGLMIFPGHDITTNVSRMVTSQVILILQSCPHEDISCVKDTTNSMSEKWTTKYCCLKEGTLQTFVILKIRHYKLL